VNVVFSPLAPGTRNGAVVLYDISTPPNVMATVALTGTGIAPAIGFGPGIISTVAGNGTQGYNADNIPATNAWLNGPRGVAMDGSGNLYIADSYNHRVRKVNATTGTITTVAGNGIAG
jgi:hypothetical protein